MLRIKLQFNSRFMLNKQGGSFSKLDLGHTNRPELNTLAIFTPIITMNTKVALQKRELFLIQDQKLRRFSSKSYKQQVLKMSANIQLVERVMKVTAMRAGRTKYQQLKSKAIRVMNSRGAGRNMRQLSLCISSFYLSRDTRK